MSTSHYRPDVDGVRAYAVMAVVLFHLSPNWLSGGYIGVGVSSVISGFLITKIIVNEVQVTGTFSFANFYARPAHQLFPAMILTVILTTISALMVFPPSLLKSDVSEAAFSVISMSNFYFWGQAGYFDAQAISKPLLHTWSLAVEEQFYIFWPLFTVLLFAKPTAKKALAISFGVSLISYWSNIVMVRMGELDTVFFSCSLGFLNLGLELLSFGSRKSN